MDQRFGRARVVASTQKSNVFAGVNL